MVKEAKEKFLLKNCKCFFKNEKIMLIASFLLDGIPPLPVYEPGSYQQILTIFLINGEISFAVCQVRRVISIWQNNVFFSALCLKKNLIATMT